MLTDFDFVDLLRTENAWEKKKEFQVMIQKLKLSLSAIATESESDSFKGSEF